MTNVTARIQCQRYDHERHLREEIDVEHDGGPGEYKPDDALHEHDRERHRRLVHAMSEEPGEARFLPERRRAVCLDERRVEPAGRENEYETYNPCHDDARDGFEGHPYVQDRHRQEVYEPEAYGREAEHRQ